MDDMTYYRQNLAVVHHLGYGGHADACAPGILALAEPYRGAAVLEIGCGSGALTSHLVNAGHDVVATDASPAMLQLARESVPEATVSQLTLPDDPIPPASFIVGVGHPLNYLSNLEEVERAIVRCVDALLPGGMMVVDICGLDYADGRSSGGAIADIHDDWAIFARFSLPEPTRFVREMTTFVKAPDGRWDRDDETHANVLVDLGPISKNLEAKGLLVAVTDTFGDEEPTPGIRVLRVVKAS